MQCVLVLNARQNAAKCSAKYGKKPFNAMKHMARKGKMAIKKWGFRG